MSFFFDGVPVPGSKPATVASEEEARAIRDVGNVVLPDPGEPARIIASVHPPFENGACISCHASQFSQSMKEPAPKLCFECHDNFQDKAKVRHQADCTSCHSPHESPNKKLLVRLGREMCLECHDDPVGKGKGRVHEEPGITDFLGALPKLVPALGNKVKHQPVESGCLDCHTPHASDTKGLLKKPVAATCFECHDDFLKSAKVKHDPAANGECMSCHSPHASDFNALLIKKGPALCFECHEESDIKKVKVHQRFPDRECSSCHDPHGGSEEKLLKPGILKLTTAPETSAPASR